MAPRKASTGASGKKAAAKVSESKAAEKAITAAKAVEEMASETVKTAEKTSRSRRKKVETNTEVYVQFWGKEVYAKDVVANIKKIWTDEMGKKEADLTDLKVYIKPEDNGAHYVINGEITGFVEL